MARGRGKLTPQEIEALRFFSSKLNDLLNETSTKQVELSKATGIPPSTLTGYVKGTSLPIPGNVQKIADYFGLMKSDIDPRFAPRKKKHELKIPTSPLVNKITKTVVELNVPRKQQVLDYATEQLKEQKK